MHKIPLAISVGLLNVMLLVLQYIIAYFMDVENENDKLSNLQIMCSALSPPIPKSRAS